MENIDTAPKDGRLIYVGNNVHNVEMLGFWSKKENHWEGQYFSIVGSQKICWDKNSSIQPNYWRPS